MELIPKRGLKPHEKHDSGVVDMIKERGWENFIQQLEDAIMAIVREFYTNALEAEGHVVQVQGKSVSFNKSSINAYFHIRNMEDEDEFKNYRDNNFHWN